MENIWKPEIFAAICTLIGVILTVVVGPFITKLSDWLFKKSKESDAISQALNVSALVDGKLQVLKDELGADKVWIIQFHNGGTFYPTGKSIKKFSVFYERQSAGITSSKLMYQNIPVHLFHKMIDSVQINKFIQIADMNDPLTNKYDLEILTEPNDMRSFYAFAICNLENQMIGVMGIQFHAQALRLSDQQIASVIQQSGVIGGVLMADLKK